MFDYTAAAVNSILDDIKKWLNRFKIVFSILILGYLVYCIATGIGHLYVNITLFAMNVIYAIVMLIAKKRENSNAEKVVTRAYTYAKLLLKTFTLASTLYGIYIAALAIDGISVILATLTIIAWILQVLFEVLIAVLSPKIKLLKAGFMKDIKPLVDTYNFFNPKEFDCKFDYAAHQKEYDVLKAKVKERKKQKIDAIKSDIKEFFTASRKKQIPPKKAVT